MNQIPVTCSQCRKIFSRTSRRVNESKKLGWKTFCSSQCESKNKNHQFLKVCAKLDCKNTFSRRGSFCSRSCAAAVNNTKFPKRHALIKKCLRCHREYVGNKSYCSRPCKDKCQTITKEEIIDLIQKFCFKNKRIPFRQEIPQAKAARLRFGSWNKAVQAAGFRANPVKFAHKFVSNDGHKCDSFAEKVIDDWLSTNKIPHLKSPHYPNSKFTCDFKVKDTYLEFFGLSKGLKRYDQLMNEKLQMVKDNNYQLIQIFPKDIFPISNLNQILKSISN